MRSAMIWGAVVGLLAVAVVGQAPAQDSQSGGDKGGPATDGVRRLVWEHADRLCQFVDKGNEDWVEVNKEGAVTFRFKETKRNFDFVELLDRDRGYTLRLYKNAMYMKASGDGSSDFTKYYDGRWVK